MAPQQGQKVSASTQRWAVYSKETADQTDGAIKEAAEEPLHNLADFTVGPRRLSTILMRVTKDIHLQFKCKAGLDCK